MSEREQYMTRIVRSDFALARDTTGRWQPEPNGMQTFWPIVAADYVHTDPTLPNPGREKCSRRPQPNSTNNSTISAPMALVVKAEHLDRFPASQRFQWFRSFSRRLSKIVCVSKIGFVPEQLFLVFAQNVETKRVSLLESLVLKKCASVSLLKKDQTHFPEKPVIREKLFDCLGRNCRGFGPGISVNSSGNRGKGNRGKGML